MQTASEIATEAARLTGGDRAQQHGSKSANFDATAVLWNAYLGIRKGGAAAPITGADFAMMMVLAKMSRVHTGHVFNMDNFVDMAGYAACAGEVALQEQPVRDWKGTGFWFCPEEKVIYLKTTQGEFIKQTHIGLDNIYWINRAKLPIYHTGKRS